MPAARRQTSTLIFLHGLGDTGNGWAAVSENFRLRRKFDDCSFIFPHAPAIPITVNFGMHMPSWFDITEFSNISVVEDETGVMRSVELGHKIIDEQIQRGIPSNRIIIGGFSQGGAIALLAGLSCKHKLGGIIALSTWLPLRSKFASLITQVNQDTPIFLAHGKADNTVQYEWGIQAMKTLKETMGRPVEWHAYAGLDHSADPQEIDHMQKWLEKTLPDSNSEDMHETL